MIDFPNVGWMSIIANRSQNIKYKVEAALLITRPVFDEFVFNPSLAVSTGLTPSNLYNRGPSNVFSSIRTVTI